MTTLSLAAATALTATVLLTVGCDKTGQSTDNGVPPPMKPPSLSGTASSDQPKRVEFRPPADPVTPVDPAAPVRPPAVLTVDGKPILFPPTKLAVLKNTPGDFRVRLCTDDPPSAIDRNYAGNSFLFDMKLGIDSADSLKNAPPWIGKRNDFDSDAGIFIDGYKNPYRPEDVTIRFTGDPADLSIHVDGTFSHADPKDPFGPPKSVQVSGDVHVAQPGK